MDLPLSRVLMARSGVEGGLDDGVVAAGVVAVEAEAVEMDDEGVAGHG